MERNSITPGWGDQICESNPSSFLVSKREKKDLKEGEDICCGGVSYDYESEESLTATEATKKKSLSKREKEIIKGNTRWGLCNFLTKGSLQCQESQRRGCFLGRRQSPQSPGAPTQPRRHSQQTINTKIIHKSITPTSTNLTPPHFPSLFFFFFLLFTLLFYCFPFF